MMTRHRQGLFVLLAALAVFAVTADAAAQCCGAPSYGAAYQTYSPVTYTAYQPVSSWYPGCCLFNWWGGGYTAGYAPTYSTYYQPAYYASYRPAYYASYAPASSCSPCSTCTTYYAPSCTTCYDPCSSCCPNGCATCYDGSGCAACGVTQASATDSYPADSYQRQPQLSPGEEPPRERSTYETEKPESNNAQPDMFPAPNGESSDENASLFEAPRLFNPKDQTALGNGVAPVRTAVYRKPVAGQPSKLRNISVSRRQAQLDAEGWTSVSE